MPEPHSTITISDGLLIAATVVGPIAAVQVQKFIERTGERNRRRLQLFDALMGTRATRLADAHVQALNRIDLEFMAGRWAWLFRGQAKKDRAVITAWRDYALQLNVPFDPNSEAQTVAWNGRLSDLFIELLFQLSHALKFDFTKEHLQRGIYHPTAHANREEAQLKVLHNAARVLAGEQPLKMAVTEFPVSQAAVDAQVKLQEKLSGALGDGALRVEIGAGKAGA